MASNWLKAELLRTSVRAEPPQVARRQVATCGPLPTRVRHDEIAATAQRVHAA
jgi:hypothetical protein